MLDLRPKGKGSWTVRVRWRKGIICEQCFNEIVADCHKEGLQDEIHEGTSQFHIPYYSLEAPCEHENSPHPHKFPVRSVMEGKIYKEINVEDDLTKPDVPFSKWTDKQKSLINETRISQ